LVKKYDSFTHRTREYVVDYVQMIKSSSDHIGGGKYSPEYSRLTKARDRMKKPFLDHIEGFFSIPESIYRFQWGPENRKNSGIEKAIPISEKFPDLHLYGKGFTEEMKDKILSMSIDLYQEVFDEKYIDRLFDNMFRFNDLIYQTILTENHKEYFVEMAVFMVKIGIFQIRKYMSDDQFRLLLQDLKRTTEICDMVKNSKDKRLREVI